MYYNINFEEFHKKETENKWKAMESSEGGWNGDLWKKLCHESAEKHLGLLHEKITGIPDFSGPFITEDVIKKSLNDLLKAHEATLLKDKISPKISKKKVSVQKKVNLEHCGF